MLLSKACVFIQLIPQPAQAALHTEKWQQELGGNRRVESQRAYSAFHSYLSIHLRPLLGTNSQLGGGEVRSADTFWGSLIAL